MDCGLSLPGSGTAYRPRGRSLVALGDYQLQQVLELDLADLSLVEYVFQVFNVLDGGLHDVQDRGNALHATFGVGLVGTQDLTLSHDQHDLGLVEFLYRDLSTSDRWHGSPTRR